MVWQPTISESIYDFTELFRTVWQQRMHLRGHFLFHFMPKNVSEMTGHGDLVGKGSNMLPWHQKSLPHLQKASSCGDTLSKLSAESFIKFTLCSYSLTFSRKTLTLHFSPPFFPLSGLSPCFSFVSHRHLLFQEC